jgi:hypothetical protein
MGMHGDWFMRAAFAPGEMPAFAGKNNPVPVQGLHAGITIVHYFATIDAFAQCNRDASAG